MGLYACDGGFTMTDSINQDKKESTIELVDLSNLESLDGTDSSAYMCDVETGICGPADEVTSKVKELKDEEEG